MKVPPWGFFDTIAGQTYDYLRSHLSNDRLTDDMIHESVTEGSTLNRAVEITLKGKELRMPEGPGSI